MDIEALLDHAKDTMTVKRVFGEPIERNDVVVIPVAVVVGGGGGGQSEDRPGRPGNESGAGFGVWARPIGVYVIRGESVVFRPAIGVSPLLVLGVAYLLSRLRRARRGRTTSPS